MTVPVDALRDFRHALDAAGDVDGPTFARRARNGVAKAVLAAALTPETAVCAPSHAPPADEVRAHVGPELAAELIAVYDGGEGWTSRAIGVLEPLHELARA